jgi:hypothetical protein
MRYADFHLLGLFAQINCVAQISYTNTTCTCYRLHKLHIVCDVLPTVPVEENVCLRESLGTWNELSYLMPAF